ncbi:MAG: lysylphosphatidylglycerol synthase domain-containing protein [Planctomycetaceae bacterium]
MEGATTPARTEAPTDAAGASRGSPTLRALRASDIRVFSSASDAPTARRPTDVVLLALSVLGVGLVSLVAPGPTALGQAVARLVDDLPGTLGWAWELGYDVLLGWAAFLVVAALVARGRKRLFLAQLLAGAFSLGFAVVSGGLGGTARSDSLGAIWGTHPPAIYPATRLAVATAVIVTASPHLSRPLRFLGRWIVFVGATASIALGIALTIGVVTGLLVGLGSAALVHLLFGSPGGRLTLEQVNAALRDLGVDAEALRHAPLQPSGVALVEGVGADGRRVVVKVHGRDAWDGQLIASTWSSLWRRGETPRVGGRLQQVEHEAFVTLLAERARVPVLPVVAAGLAAGRDAVLVLEADAVPLANLEPARIDDRVLAGLWDIAERLRDAGIAHGALDRFRLLVRPDGSPVVADFGAAATAAPDLAIASDRAHLLVSTALLVGRERAVAAAARALGSDGLAAILPCIQPAIVDRETRHEIRDRDWDLEDLLALSAQTAGVEPPELEQLRRVTWSSVITVALIALVAYVIISAVAQVGLQSLIDSFRSADAVWLLGALVVSPLVQIPQAFSTIGASIQPVRYGPVLMLQYAVQFIQLAVPSSAARIALEIRFFERNGVASAGAVAIGAIDGVSGFLIQAILILVITLSGLATLDLSSATSTSSSSGGGHGVLLTVLVVGAVLAVIVALVVPTIRARVLEAIPRYRSALRERAAEGRASLRVLRHPSKLAMLFGGNLTAQVFQAAVLGLCLHAFGQTATMAQLILINTAVSLFAGFMPVPGGMGVAEAGYTAGLVAIGVPHTVAFSTAIAFRMVTYYLPPIWGGFAMRWLRRHAYV